jgi:hypothetical protein
MLFSLSRWGPGVGDEVEDVEAKLTAELSLEKLPKMCMKERMPAGHSIPPGVSESMACLVKAYDAMACEHEDGQDGSAYRYARGGPTYTSARGGPVYTSARSGSTYTSTRSGSVYTSTRSGSTYENTRSGSHTNAWKLIASNMDSPGEAGRAPGVCPVDIPVGVTSPDRAASFAPGENYVNQVEFRKALKADLRSHLQKKLIGFILQRIHWVQDFMSIVSYANDKGIITEEKKRRTRRMNNLILPWVSFLAQIMIHERLNKIIDTHGKTKGLPGSGITIYARVNLENNGMYIGETGNFDTRFTQHFMNTFRHSEKCKQPCKSCREHTKYRKHRTVSPHRWIMMPIFICQEKYEAKRIERKLVKMWKPSLNQGDKPFWLLKDTYAADNRKLVKKFTERQPWNQGECEECEPDERETENYNLNLLTTYEHDGKSVYDIGLFLTAREGGKCSISVTSGKSDVTNWPRIKEVFGPSEIITISQLGTDTCTMKDWSYPKNLYAFTIIIRPERYATENSEHILKLIEISQAKLEACSEDELEQYWKNRNTLDKEEKYKLRKLIWAELERRYEGLSAKPLEVRIPYHKSLDSKKLRGEVNKRIMSHSIWPTYIREYHVRNLKFVTEASSTFEDILCNMNKPTKHPKACTCQHIQQKRRETNLPELATVKGHVFIIGRDYQGPFEEVLKVAAGNIPTQTIWDLKRAWEKATEKLPVYQGNKKTWEKMLYGCIAPRQHTAHFPTTRDTYLLKKTLDGLIIGPIDKNKGELSLVCPKLYYEALENMYNKEAGYEEVHIAKLSAYRKQRYSNRELPEQIIRKEKAPVNQRGTTQDIIKMWQRIYKTNGWQRYAPFNTKGDFNQPYIMFKAKNITNHQTRQEKWKKTRPISPGTSHPMRKLLGLVGRAWSFVTANMVGEHFIIPHGGKVPQFLEEASKLRYYGDLSYVIKDIEGCFPNMPKHIIRHALKKVSQDITKTHGFEGVAVPRHKKSEPCSWRKNEKRNKIWIPFDVMLDVMDFALDNAFVRMPDGSLRRQMNGIPMGDPISPGMTIGACAWMENEWMESLAQTDKLMFKAKRYMDDIIMVYAKAAWWDHERFVADFTRSEIYCEPLTLTDGDADTFLETTLKLSNDGFEYWLKNQNAESQKIWRYQHFNSYSPMGQKKALVKSCLRKVHNMASNSENLKKSAIHKLKEFLALEYPKPILKQICNYIATTTGNGTWIKIRNNLLN